MSGEASITIYLGVIFLDEKGKVAGGGYSRVVIKSAN